MKQTSSQKLYSFSPSKWTSEIILDQTMTHIAPLPCQASYAKALASIFAMHLHRNELMDDGLSPDELPSPSALVVAPTGQGKTFLVRKMAEFLGLNVVTVDCSTLSAEGWKGISLSQRLAAAMSETNDDEAFERSILFMDEIDKLKLWKSSNDQGNAMVNILQMFNDGTVAIQMSNGTKHLDISRFTVLMGGAFEGLDKIVERRLYPRPKIGFSSEKSEEKKLSKAELLQQVTTEDLVEFGMMRELLGRVGTVLSISPMGKEDFRLLLNADSGSIRSRYQNYFAGLFGADVEITDACVDVVAGKCMKASTGARAVTPLVDGWMRGAISALEADTSICKAILDARDGECFVRYEYGPRSYSYRALDRVQRKVDLHVHTVRANNLPALTRKLCRYYRNAGGSEEYLPQLEAYLNCTLLYLFTRARPSERNFDSLEKMARTTRANGRMSIYGTVIRDAKLSVTEEYRRFDMLCDRRMQPRLVYALQTIMRYIQERHGVCCMHLEVRHPSKPPQSCQ